MIGGDPAILLQLVQRRVERSIADLQDVAGNLLEALQRMSNGKPSVKRRAICSTFSTAAFLFVAESSHWKRSSGLLEMYLESRAPLNRLRLNMVTETSKKAPRF